MHFSTIFVITASVGTAFTIRLFLDFRRAVRAINGFPGLRLLLSPSSIAGNLFPWALPGVWTGRHYSWKRKHEDFEKAGCDIFTAVSAFPTPTTVINVADADVVKEICGNRARFPKRVEQYGVVLTFGRNIVGTEGDEWKKHRKIANPAFSEPNNKYVWSEAVRITLDMIDNVWQGKEVVEIDHGVDITLALALLIIGSAGFGREISFAEDTVIPSGHTMSFKDALHNVSTDILLLVVFPDWLKRFGAMKINEKFREVDKSAKELRLYMQEMIDERRVEEKKAEKFDLFTMLLDANQEEAEGAETRLDNSELIGNIFVFLLAGHETTAHTLCFTLALLALYPDEQETLYQHIKSVLSDGRIPTYEDMNQLSYCQAVLYETLRLFPPVNGVPKKSAEDTTFVTTNILGERMVCPVPKDAVVVPYIVGLHYNPKYWKDPHEFRPSRFNEDWPRDAFLPFSGGARSCIGRRFSETESIAILAVLLARYRVEVKDEPQFAGETFEQRRERVTANKAGITMTPIRVPLTFIRR